MKKIIWIILGFIFVTNAVVAFDPSGPFTIKATQIGINQPSPDASAILDIVSNTLGFLAPRMDTSSRDAISTPATGLLIYNTTTNEYNFFDSSVWVAMGVLNHGDLLGLLDDDHTQYSLLSSQAGAPSSTPSRLGELNIDTTADLGYISTGTASSADWDQILLLNSIQSPTNKTIADPTNYIHSDVVHILVRNISGLTITKGQPIFISGYNSGQDRMEIELAEADVTVSMPSVGIVSTDILNNANGEVISAGALTGIDTSSFSVGDTLFVSTTAGILTNVRPSTNGDLVQAVAKVVRSHATLGVITISGSNRANDIPNNLTMINSGMFRTGTTAADTALLSAFDVDGASYTTFATLTANDTPTFDLQPTTFSLSSFTQGSIPFIGASGLFTEDNSNLFWNDTDNRLGIGTATPDRVLHSEVSDAATTTVSFPLRLSHVTSGTAAAGFGAGLEFKSESGSGGTVVIGSIESILSSAIDGAEESNLVFKTLDVGDDNLSIRMTINKDGNVGMAMNPANGVGLIVAGPSGGTGLITVADTSSVFDWLTLLVTTGGNPAIFWESTTDLRIGTGTSPSGAGFVERARFTSDGKFGIGIAPTTALHIDSNAADSTPIQTWENTGGACRIFRVTSNPEGSITANRCDIAIGIVANEGVLYIKEKGDSNNVGWKKFGTAHFANMLIHNNSIVTVIDTVDITHFIQGLFIDEISEDFTFAAGSTGPISAFADAGSGQVTVTDTAHGLSTGAVISISGTTNYNDVFTIANALANTFEITDAFVADDATGNWYKGDSVTAAAGSAGNYEIAFSTYGLSAANNKDFLFTVFKNSTVQNALNSKRRFPSSVDIGTLGGNGIIQIEDGDVIAFAITGLSDATNFTIEHVSLSLNKL